MIKQLPGGIKVEVIEREHMQKLSGGKGRYYEQDMLEYIRRFYKSGTFIDGGACIGNHSLYFAKFCAQQVIAIEPVARNMAHLKKNLALNDLKVITIAAALGSQPGYASMHKIGNNHGNYELIAGDEVEVITLDSLMPLVQFPVTLVKLDIEGSELDTLHGARNLLHTHHPALFIEAAKVSMRDKIGSFLSGYGYSRIARFNWTPTYLYRVNS